MKHWFLTLASLVATLGLLGYWITPNDARLSTQQLVDIIQDPQAYQIGLAAQELGNRPEDAALSAPALAVALRYATPERYTAGLALIKLGPAAASAVPALVVDLQNS